MNRHLCTKEKEGDLRLFSLHALVKESMEMFLVDNKTRVETLRYACRMVIMY